MGKLFPKAGCYGKQKRHSGMTREISRDRIHILGRLETHPGITTLFEKRDIKPFFFLNDRALPCAWGGPEAWTCLSLTNTPLRRPSWWVKQTDGKSVSVTYYLYDFRQIIFPNISFFKWCLLQIILPCRIGNSNPVFLLAICLPYSQPMSQSPPPTSWVHSVAWSMKWPHPMGPGA